MSVPTQQTKSPGIVRGFFVVVKVNPPVAVISAIGTKRT
jgi:hypothetical protein